MKTIPCEDCGQVCEQTGPSQKYCKPCSHKRSLKRKQKWSNSHRPTSSEKKRWSQRSKPPNELSREAGLEENRKHKRSIFWYEESTPGLRWMLRVMVPFSYATSKNHIYALRDQGHLFLRKESKAKRQEITLAIRQGLTDRKVAHNKIWIDMLVQKPNHRGDAINVVDLVCDAVKDAVPVDDRWFCIRRLDWEIVKEDPQLIIGIGQETCEDAQVCSYCGQIKPLSAFTKSKHNPLGVGRECCECRRVGRLLKKQSAETALAS